MIGNMNQRFNKSKVALPKTSLKKKDDEDMRITSQKDEEIDKKLENLEQIHQQNIKNFIKANNKNKFNQIKYLLRNMFLSIIFSFAFLKLSKIKS